MFKFNHIDKTVQYIKEDISKIKAKRSFQYLINTKSIKIALSPRKWSYIFVLFLSLIKQAQVHNKLRTSQVWLCQLSLWRECVLATLAFMGLNRV